MGQIIIKPEVRDNPNSLIYTLYKHEYFGFIESAKQYVVSIY